MIPVRTSSGAIQNRGMAGSQVVEALRVEAIVELDESYPCNKFGLAHFEIFDFHFSIFIFRPDGGSGVQRLRQEGGHQDPNFRVGKGIPGRGCDGSRGTNPKLDTGPNGAG